MGEALLENPIVSKGVVRVVMDGKGRLGDFPLTEALELAEKEGLDLVLPKISLFLLF
jgi:translation initiation factor IF-3